MPRSKVMSATIAINTIEEAVGVPFELERYCGTSFLLLCRLATSNYWVNATMLDAWMRKKIRCYGELLLVKQRQCDRILSVAHY